MIKHYYKHLGYYDNLADIREISGKSAEEILDYYKQGNGHFYEDEYHEEETDLIAEEETLNVEKGYTKFTTDKKYAITDELYNGCDVCFIDIYELYKEEDCKDITYEVCPHCSNQVELVAELKVQKCPVCGKHIVTCSMCKNPELDYYCKDCCLQILALSLNDEITE